MSRTGFWILCATIGGSSMAFIDGTAVNVALPALQADLGATVTELQWVVEAYMLLLAALILVGGAAGDRFGRRKVFGLGILLFALASAWCALAPDAFQLVVARAAQGIGGALLVPGSLAIISAAFGDAERGRAIGAWSAWTAITTAGGQVLGGWLVETVSWRAIFWLNLPVAALVLAVLFLAVPESRGEAQGRPLDWLGAFLATAGLFGLVYGLVQAPAVGWGQPAVVGGLAAGTLALVAFVAAEHRAPAPMLPLGLFGNATFAGANGLTLALYAALGGALFFVPLNLIQVQGYSATATGAAMLPFIFLMAVLSGWAGGLAGRIGPRLPLTLGPLVAAAGFALFALPGVGGGYWLTFFPAIAVLGLGMAVTVAPLTTAVMGAVPQDQAGVASGINNAVARMAGLLAIALFGGVMLAVFSRGLAARLHGLALSPAARDALIAEASRLGGLRAPAGLPAPLGHAVEAAVKAAFVDGFRVVMLLAAVLAAVSALVTALAIRPDRRAECP